MQFRPALLGFLAAAALLASASAGRAQVGYNGIDGRWHEGDRVITCIVIRPSEAVPYRRECHYCESAHIHQYVDEIRHGAKRHCSRHRRHHSGCIVCESDSPPIYRGW